MRLLTTLPLILTSLLMIALACEARPGNSCGPGGCSGGGLPQGFPMAEPIYPYRAGDDLQPYRWVNSSDPAKSHQVYLYRGNTQVGGWDYRDQIYRSYFASADRWGMAENRAPIDPPAAPVEEVRGARLQAFQLNGVDREKLDADPRPEYSINGKAVSKWSVYDALLDDDSGKLWLVVIGSDDQRKRISDDMANAPALSALKSKTRLWSVPPTHFSLRDRESNQPIFDLSGSPSIYLLGADGDLLEKRMAYGGPEDLRRIDPEVKKQEEAAAAAAAKKKADDEAAALKKKLDDELAAAKKKADDEAALKKPNPNTPAGPDAPIHPAHVCGIGAAAGIALYLLLKGK